MIRDDGMSIGPDDLKKNKIGIKGASMAVSKTTIGYLVQLGGICAFAVGAIFSVHHLAIAGAFIGGAAAFYVGQKLRSIT